MRGRSPHTGIRQGRRKECGAITKDQTEDLATNMEGVMKVAQLGETNHLSWLADVEQICKLKDCWDVVVAPIPMVDAALLSGLESIPTKPTLTMTMTDPNESAENKRVAGATLGALEWRRKDQVAQAILKLNLEDGKHDALKECSSAHGVYSQVLDSFTSRGRSGKIELRRRLCSLRKAAKESMTSFINRASMLKIEMNRMGISTPEEERVAALLAGLPAVYAGTVELIENHGPEDLAGVTRRLLAAELKRRRLERDEDEAVAMAAGASSVPPKGVPYPSRPAPGAPAQGPLYAEVMPSGYAAAPSYSPAHQYYPMPTHTYFMPAQLMPHHLEGNGGYNGRPPRVCWGCGLPGHVQRQCMTHPPVPRIAPPAGAGMRLGGRLGQHWGPHPVAPHSGVGENMWPLPPAQAAGAQTQAIPRAPWGLPHSEPPAAAGGPGHYPAAGAPAPKGQPGPPARRRPGDGGGPRNPGGLSLMAMATGAI